MAQDKTSISIESLPGKLEWIEHPDNYSYESGILKILSGAKTDNPIYAGFLSQSPTGEGCEAIFTDIVYTNKKLEDLRSGS